MCSHSLSKHQVLTEQPGYYFRNRSRIGHSFALKCIIGCTTGLPSMRPPPGSSSVTHTPCSLLSPDTPAHFPTYRVLPSSRRPFLGCLCLEHSAPHSSSGWENSKHVLCSCGPRTLLPDPLHFHHITTLAGSDLYYDLVATTCLLPLH